MRGFFFLTVFRSNWNLECGFFLGWSKTEGNREKPSQQRWENHQQPQPTCNARFSNPIRVREVRDSSSHHYAIPASQLVLFVSLLMKTKKKEYEQTSRLESQRVGNTDTQLQRNSWISSDACSRLKVEVKHCNGIFFPWAPWTWMN